MHSLAEENYLKALYHLANHHGLVAITELSKHLDVKMPTATSMMKKLAEKKLVHYESYKPIRLTEKGKKSAAIVIRKHRLTEMFLVQTMGFGWEKVHSIAEQLEHIHHPYFFDKMDEMLGYPKVDPHGSPIPDKNGKVDWIAYVKLSECKAGQTVTLRAVTHSSAEFLQFLNNQQLRLGLKLKIKSVESFDGSMQITYTGKTNTFSLMVCEKLLVE